MECESIILEEQEAVSEEEKILSKLRLRSLLVKHVRPELSEKLHKACKLVGEIEISDDGDFRHFVITQPGLRSSAIMFEEIAENTIECLADFVRTRIKAHNQ